MTTELRMVRGLLVEPLMTGKADFSPEEWRTVAEGPPSARGQHGLQHLRDAIEILERTATPDEVSDYRRFVRTLAEKVANAHREDGVAVSPAEQSAIDEVSAALGAVDPQ
jgi:hypothetical protein